MVSGLATADVLPQPVPENQVFTTTSIIEAVGVVSESTSVVWQVGDAGLTELAIPEGAGGEARSGSIAYVTYSESIATNGGQISEVKTFSMDTHAKTAGMYNIETTKVLTYTSQNGSHLMGAESYVLDVAGDWNRGVDDMVCVFSKKQSTIIPAFCNKVTASSKLTSVTTAQVQTVGGLTAVAYRQKQDVPAALNYEISVTPDANSASGYADGIISTTFTVSVMEGGQGYNSTRRLGSASKAIDYIVENHHAGWQDWSFLSDPEFYPDLHELASTVTYIDTATVAGGISTFNKVFSYQSGIDCEYC